MGVCVCVRVTEAGTSQHTRQPAQRRHATCAPFLHPPYIKADSAGGGLGREGGLPMQLGPRWKKGRVMMLFDSDDAAVRRCNEQSIAAGVRMRRESSEGLKRPWREQTFTLSNRGRHW